MSLPRLRPGDAVLAAALTAFGVVGTAGADGRTDLDLPMDPAGYGLVVVAAVGLAVRRAWPVAVLAFVTVATSTYLALGYPYGPILVSFLVAVYTVARHRPPRTSAAAAAVALLPLLVHLWTHPDALPGVVGVVPASAWVVVPFAVGATVRLQRENEARARAELLRRRIDEERLQVAQEVHDVVGHGLAAITMQANVALHLLRKQPEGVEAALTAISRTGTEALEELRATLGVVRAGDGEPGGGTGAGLARMGELRRRMEAAGVRVQVETTGVQRPLPPAADLAGYRVVQEALTNVLRHGDVRTATVRVHHEEDAVTLLVSNAVRGVSPVADGAGDVDRARSSDGMGLAGMRRRIAAVGGELDAGPTAGGRFEVRARIPREGPA